MADDRNSSDHKSNADTHQATPQDKHIVHSIERQSKDQDSQSGEDDPDTSRKPAFAVRFIHFLWRRRKWRRMRKADHPGPNWAEITTVCLTLGIVLAAFIQVGIYQKQAHIMERSLQQNQQSIALNMGQVAIAGRNAKTAEDSLAQIKSGETDTHNLAVAAKDQAAAAKLQVEEMKKQGTDTHELAVQAGKQASAASIQVENTKESLRKSEEIFRISQQPYMTVGRKDGVVAEIKESQDPNGWASIVLYWQNAGHLPARTVCMITTSSAWPVTAPKAGPSTPLMRQRGRDSTGKLQVMESGCPTVGGDSAFAYIIPDPFTQKTFDAVKAKKDSQLSVWETIQYCDSFGHYVCKSVFLNYLHDPINGFQEIGENDCSGMYRAVPNIPQIMYGPNEQLPPCSTPEEEQKNQEEKMRSSGYQPIPEPKDAPK